jgi:hypothetical protein
MKNYLKRLKDHPGVLFATLLTGSFTVAAFLNENLSVQGALFVAALSSAFVWSIVLISNIERHD